MRLVADRDFICGIALAALGAAAIVAGADLTVGSATEMGEGYVPLATAGALAALGVAIAVRAALRAPGERVPLEALHWRAPLFVTAAILAFAAALAPLGAIAAIALSVTAASFAGEPLPARALILLVAALCLGVWAVFLWGLGLPVAALPRIGG